jgi:predicted dehydrogenase
LGVIGLGRPWTDRFREALARRADRFRIAAVHDPVGQRAASEADRLGCPAVRSIRALAGHPEVDALVILGSSWAGPIPLRFALETGKPCLAALPCRVALAELRGRLGEAPRVLLDLPGRFEASTMRMRELFATRLGRPRMLAARFPAPGPEGGPDALMDLACDRVDWCRFLFQGEPVAARSTPGGEAGAPTAEIALIYPEGGAAELALAGEGAPEIRVVTERGSIEVQGVDRLTWTDESGPHEEHLAHDSSSTDVLLEQFHRLATGATSLAPAPRDLLFLADLIDRFSPGA